MSDSNGRPAPARDADEVRRHEAHLVSQIYHLIEANQKLEEQVDRLAKVTEIAGLFREKGITRDTYRLAPPRLVEREGVMQVDPDWLADVRVRLIAAEQAVAFLNEQTRELDLLRREKDTILDGATRLQGNIDDLWKSLNEKTTHIQRLEGQLRRIQDKFLYRAWSKLQKRLGREGKP